MSTVIKVENISKQYRLGDVGTGALAHDVNKWWHKIRGKENPYLKIGETNDRATKGESDYVWALKDINFEVKQGEVLGIIGRNGAGKSTLLKILSKTTTPTTGKIKIKGRIASLLEVGTGFHPELSGRDNIFLNGAILGMTKREIKSKFDEIVDFAGVERYIDTPVKRYSSGMYVRLAFGVAAHLEPEILIVDEVLAVGDAEFQKKAMGKMKDVSEKGGRTVLFVSHNITAIKQLCNNCVILKNGNLVDYSNTISAISKYMSVDSLIRLKKSWSLDDAPGNEIVKLLDIVIHDQKGNIPEDGNFIITESIAITIKYKVLKEGYSFIHGANIYNDEDVNIFNSHDVTSDIRHDKRSVGFYEATMFIPENLMSEGNFAISIALFIPSPFELHAYAEKVLTFSIYDNMKGNSARGHYTQAFPGIVRPLLKWEAKKKYDL
jgi:lipopolysaccharide transport system ATP-binding protein